jgi:hypothetical protein
MKKQIYLVGMLVLITPYLNQAFSIVLGLVLAWLAYRTDDDDVEPVSKQKRAVTSKQYESYSTDKQMSIDKADVLDSVDSDWMEVTQIPK